MKRYKSIKEMKKMFHNPNYSKITIHLYKHISVYLTRILLMLPFSANFWSFMIMVLTLISAGFLLLGTYSHQITGMVFLHLAFLLDTSDGEIALYRKTYSLRGKFYDQMGHGAFPIIHFALGTGIFFSGGKIIYLLLGCSSLFFHAYCNHNRWAYVHILKEGGRDINCIMKKESMPKKILRLFTMGNFEFETGAILFISIALGLDTLIVTLFGIWLPIRWLVQISIFSYDLKHGKDDKRLGSTFSK